MKGRWVYWFTGLGFLVLAIVLACSGQPLPVGARRDTPLGSVVGRTPYQSVWRVEDPSHGTVCYVTSDGISCLPHTLAASGFTCEAAALLEKP